MGLAEEARIATTSRDGTRPSCFLLRFPFGAVLRGISAEGNEIDITEEDDTLSHAIREILKDAGLVFTSLEQAAEFARVRGWPGFDW